MLQTVVQEGISVRPKTQDELFADKVAKSIIDIQKGTTPTKAEVLNRGNSGGYPHFLFSINNPFVDRRWVNHFLYENISWVYSCAQMTANSAELAGISIIPIKHKKKPSARVEKFIEAIENLFENANEEQDFAEIYRQIHVDCATNGKGYIAIEFLENHPPFKTPIALYRIDYRTIESIRLYQIAERMGMPSEFFQQKKNRLLGWKQTILLSEDIESFLEPTGQREKDIKAGVSNYVRSDGDNVRYFYPEQIIEIKLDASGTSPLDCLEFALVTEISAHQYTYAYFRNSTKAGIILSLKNKTTKAEAMITKNWLENEYSNPESAGKPMLLTGDIQLIRDSAKTSEVQYLDIRKFNLVDVCAAMGVDSQLIYSEAKTTEKEEAKRAFEESTVVPRSQRILRRITSHFGKIFPEMKGKFKIIPGVKGRSSLHLLNIAQKMAMSGATLNECRGLIGLPDIKTNPLYDEPLIAANIMPAFLIEKMADAKSVGSNPQKDNNPAGQPRGENPQGGKSGRTNEQRG